MSEPQEKLDISDLKDTFLECPVCVEHFNQTDRCPRLLHSCLHAFCTQCLHQLLIKEGKSQITCPLCRQTQKVTGKVDSLPMDPVRGKLVEYVQIKHNKKMLCTDCPDGSEAEGRCHECHVYLCTLCIATHKRHNLTKKHGIVPLEEMLNSPVKNLKGHFCEKHTDHKIEFYCSNCSELCCVSCTVLNHKGHEMEAVQDAAKRKLFDFDSQIAQLNITANAMRIKRTSVLQKAADEEKVFVRSAASINEQFDKLIQLLNERRSSLLSELQTTKNNIVDDLKKQTQATEDTLAVMDSVMEYYAQMKSKSDDCDEIGEQSVLNGNDIPPGRGFQSISRMSSVDDHHSGRSSRDVDASDTFNHFASLKCYNTPALKDPTSKSLKIQDSKDGRAAADSGSLFQESRGAVGGREYTHSMTEGERQHLLSRDEPVSFTSTFAGEESMLRDLDNAPRDELDKTRTSVKFSSYGGTASDVTDGSKYSFSLPGGIRVKVYHGNIITAKTEGIVNAANSELKNYAGVAGGIEKACGGIMRRECEKYIRQNGPLNISEVIHTSAGDLRGTLYILHTVGPVYIPSMDKQCGTYLTMTFLRCLDHARKKLRIHSLAFPFISTGVYGASLEMCVEAFLDAVVMFSNSHKSDPGVTEIQLVNTDLEMVQRAIVMIRQHLGQGLDVLVDKAMSRLQEKRSARDENEKCSSRSLTTSSAGTKSGVGKRNTSSSKSDFSKTTPDFKTYGISKQAGTKDNYKPRPATTTGVNSPRSRPGPMKASNSTTSAGYQFSHADDHTTLI